jgi:hypothetical protein
MRDFYLFFKILIFLYIIQISSYFYLIFLIILLFIFILTKKEVIIYAK